MEEMVIAEQNDGGWALHHPSSLNLHTECRLALEQSIKNRYEIERVHFDTQIWKEMFPEIGFRSELEVDAFVPRLNYIIDNELEESVGLEISEAIAANVSERLLELKTDYVISFQDKDVLSVKMNQYSFFYGAANGDNSYYSINIDLLKKST